MAKDLQRHQTMPADFHSHILPALDDGSESAEGSLAMLAEAKRQGTSLMVATPHFYADTETPDSFLSRRAKSIRQLLNSGYNPRIHPSVYVGAEVAYFHGIGRSEDLKRLCIFGTKIVLIEMPFCHWTSAILEDLYSIQTYLGLFPILAHIERYTDMRKASMRRTMMNRGIFLQINADMVRSHMTRRRALRMLMKGEVQLLGSDCHNMTTRPPGMRDMLNYMMDHSDENFLPQMIEFGRFLLHHAVPMEKIPDVP